MYLHSALPYSASSPQSTFTACFSNGACVSGPQMRTACEQALGMQGRRVAVPMLFVYPNAKRARYHMRNVAMPLELAELDSTGRILNLTTMQPGRSIYGNTRHAIALELPAGTVAHNLLRVGDTIAFG